MPFVQETDGDEDPFDFTIDGTVAIFHLDMGKAQLQLGETAEAREHLRRAVDLNPVGPEAEEGRRQLQELK